MVFYRRNKGDEAKNDCCYCTNLLSWSCFVEEEAQAEESEHHYRYEDGCPSISWAFVERNDEVRILKIFNLFNRLL